jgi:hypothetical protein
MDIPHKTENPGIKGEICSCDTWPHVMQRRSCVVSLCMHHNQNNHGDMLY